MTTCSFGLSIRSLSGRLFRLRSWSFMFLLAVFITMSGCHSASPAKQNSFFTSGNREADQRASQRMAKAEQLAGSGEGAGEKGEKGEKKTGPGGAAQAPEKTSLYERLGGEAGISKIVDDFMPRLLQDPRVNWERKGVKRGGFLSFHSNQSVTWNATPTNVANLKKHMSQFLALATGGPAHYDGKEMKAAHSGLHISNAEFDAAVGDIKASLDNLQIPNKDQKELLAIVESTRPQVVEER